MATLSATRSNPSLKSLSTRVKETGKPGALWAEVARCAQARELLHLACAVIGPSG